MGSFFAIFLLFGLPFMVFPFGISWFEIPKVLAFEALVASLALWVVWKEKKWNGGLLVMLAAGFWTLQLLWGGKIWGNPFRLKGVFWMINMLAMLSLAGHLRIPEKWMGRISLAFLVIQTVLVFVVGGDEGGRAVGSLGEANSLAALAIAMMVWNWGKGQTQAFASIFLASAVVILSGSRSGAAGLMAAILYLLLLARFGVKYALTGVILLFVGVHLLTPVYSVGVYENRAEIWQTGVKAGLLRPIGGWGTGNAERGLDEASDKLQNNVRFQLVDSAHNLFLDWWLEGGLVGLSIMTAILGMGLSGLIKTGKSRETAALVGIIFVLAFNPVSTAVWVWYFWLLGTGAGKKA